jgi:transcriptional regulator with XRE-family HTH domain
VRGIHANIFGRYELGEAKPSIDIALKLAEALEVSLDYLMGKDDMLTDQGNWRVYLTISKNIR